MVPSGVMWPVSVFKYSFVPNLGSARKLAGMLLRSRDMLEALVMPRCFERDLDTDLDPLEDFLF